MLERSLHSLREELPTLSRWPAPPPAPNRKFEKVNIQLYRYTIDLTP